MQRTILSLAALSSAALLTGASSGPASAAAPAPCPKPTVATCAATSTTSSCGQLNLEACKTLLHDAWKKNPAPLELRPMLKVGGDDMPADVHANGRFYPAPPRRAIKPGLKPKLLMQSLSVLIPTLPALTPVGGAKNGHRNKSWENNGSKVSSCEEYAYEWIYDWGRFLDSSALCGPDRKCFADVAFQTNTPGVARRVLKRRDGKPMAPQPALLTGVSPKNIMFSLGPAWAYADGNKALTSTPELQQMAADLAKGEVYRAIGCTTKACKAAPVQHANEWDFHDAMRKKLAGVSVEEFEEFARRRAEFQRLAALWTRAVAHEKAVIDKATSARQSKLPQLHPDIGERMPWDHLLDPWQQQNALERFTADVANPVAPSTPKINPTKLPRLPGLQSVAAPAPDWGYGFMPALPTTLPKQPPDVSKLPIQLCVNAKGLPSQRTDVHACNLANFMREEWRRKQRGQLSCLDPATDLCDWSPEMLHDRLLGMGEVYLNIQQNLQDDCVGLTKTGKFDDAHELADVAAWLKQTAAAIAKAAQALAPYALGTVPNTSWKKYGANKSERQDFGDPSWFSGGYGYGYDWSIAPNLADKDNRACRFEADSNNKLTVDASVLGRKVGLLDTGLSASANKNADNLVKLQAHLKVLGHDVFPAYDASITQAFDRSDDLYKADTPHFHAPFYAGVPMTLSAWGQLAVNYKLHGEGKFGNSCDPKDPKFTFAASFAPGAAVNAKVQLGVGIGGIASAGVRGTLNIVTVGFPLTARLEILLDKLGNVPTPQLHFDADLAITLATLAGRLALYLEFLFYEDEWEIVSWSGVGPHRIELMKLLDVNLPITGMTGN